MPGQIQSFLEWDEGEMMLGAFMQAGVQDGADEAFAALLMTGAQNPGDETAFAVTLLIDALENGGPVATHFAEFTDYKAQFPTAELPSLRRLAAKFLASYPSQSESANIEIAAMRARLLG